MKTIGKTAFWVLAIYACLWLVSAVTQYALSYGQPEYHHLYKDYPDSIYANTAHYAAYSLNRLDNSPKQIIILGASVSGYAFLPDVMAKSFSQDYKIHNLSVSGSNITQMQQVFDLMEERMDFSAIDDMTIVIAPHFVSFLENERKFRGKTTKIQNELIRHKLYRVEGDTVVSSVGDDAFLKWLAKEVVKPFILIYKIKFVLSRELKGVKIKLSTVLRESGSKKTEKKSGDFYKNFRLKQFKNHGYIDEQYKALVDFVGEIRSSGGRVVYVDMPVPDYFRKDFPIYQEYRERIKPIIKDLDIAYIDLSEAAEDQDFEDDSHPFSRAFEKWSETLAERLAKIIN